MSGPSPVAKKNPPRQIDHKFSPRRAGRITPTGVSKIIITTPEELSELVTAAVEKAFAAQREDQAPDLLDRNGIAKRLGIGVSTVDRLRREGMPSIRIGESPRFEPKACLAWLQSKDGWEPPASVKE